MKRRIYQQPETEVCRLHTKSPYMIDLNPGDNTSNQMANDVQWDGLYDDFDSASEEAAGQQKSSSLWEK